MITHGLYQLSCGGLTLGECWRFRVAVPLVGFPVALFAKVADLKTGYQWLPESEAEIPCEWDALDSLARAAFSPVIEQLQVAGFDAPQFHRMTVLEPSWLSCGGLLALHRDGQRFIFAAWLAQPQSGFAKPGIKKILLMQVGAMNKSGKALVVTNRSDPFLDDDGIIERHVHRSGENSTVSELTKRLEGILRHRPEFSRHFSSVEAARKALSVNTHERYTRRIARGLFVKVPRELEDGLLASWGCQRPQSAHADAPHVSLEGPGRIGLSYRQKQPSEFVVPDNDD